MNPKELHNTVKTTLAQNKTRAGAPAASGNRAKPERDVLQKDHSDKQRDGRMSSEKGVRHARGR